jgi:hypothetical protein
LKGDLSELNRFKIVKRRHVLSALANLSKFLGIYEDFQRLVRTYGLKWLSTKAEDLLISRMNKYETQGSVLVWIKTVKQEWPCFSVFMDFLTVSGLRCVEAVESYTSLLI